MSSLDKSGISQARFPRAARLGFYFVGFLSLTSCATTDGGTSKPFVGGTPIASSKIGAVKEPFNFIPYDRADEDALPEIRNGISGKTVLTWDKYHGPQLEYYEPSGKSYLWYPGNTIALAGEWTVKSVQEKTLFGNVNNRRNICYQYGPNSYNPVTGSRGATPECGDVADFKIRASELAPGDPFHLATGRIPFVLRKEDGVASIDDLYARMQRPLAASTDRGSGG